MRKRLSFIFKLIAVVSTVWGVSLCYVFDPTSFMGETNPLLFFTIQSNIWVFISAVVGMIMILFRIERKAIHSILKLMVTVSITLTGFIFCCVLAPTIPNAFTLSNVLTHVIAPLSAILDFLVYDSTFEYKKKWCVYALIPPIWYLCFAAYGYVKNWIFMMGLNYPYFFLNWGSPAGVFGFSSELPFMGTFYWIILIATFVVGMALLYINLATKIKKKHENDKAESRN